MNDERNDEKNEDEPFNATEQIFDEKTDEKIDEKIDVKNDEKNDEKEDEKNEDEPFPGSGPIYHEDFKFTKKYNGVRHYTYWCVFNRSRNDTCTAKLKVDLQGKIINIDGEHSEACHIKNDKKKAKRMMKIRPRADRIEELRKKRVKLEVELPDIVVKVSGAGSEEINGYYYPYAGNGKSHGWPVFSKFSSSLGYYYIKYFDGSWRICGSKEFTYQVDYYTCDRNERAAKPPGAGWKIPSSFLCRQASFAPFHSSDLDSSQSPGKLPLPTITVACFSDNGSSECAATNAKMLFSKKFSDVHFHCSDGIILHAHKIILSAASEYFSTVFESPWDNEHRDGVWKTRSPANVMRIVLTYIYTGAVEKDKVSEHATEIISLAHDYQLSGLLEKAEMIMTEKVNEFNVKQVLQTAVIYNLDILKESCFHYIKASSRNIVMEKEFMELSTKDEALWEELRTYLINFE